MNSLTIQEKLDLVLKLVAEHDITAYEIGNNTELNTSGVQKLLRGEVEKPRNSTLNIILDYIQGKIVGSDIPGHENYIARVAEPKEAYKATSSTDLLSELIDIQKTTIKLFQRVAYLEKLLKDNKIEFKDPE